MTRKHRKLLILILALLVLVQVVLPFGLSLARNRLLFFPHTLVAPESGLESFGEQVEAHIVRFERPDGRRLAAYDARPVGAGAADGPVVLFLHGNAGDIAMRAPLLARLVRETGLRWVMPDYSGYGGNPGSPSEAEVYRDALAAFDALVAGGVLPERIVLFGESLGGAVALALASERAPAGLALQSTFASLSSMTRELYPWLPLAAFLVRGAFPSDERIAGLEVPVLLVHGELDALIPITQSEQLLAAAGAAGELLRVPGAGHNDLFERAGREYTRRLGVSFREWAKARSGD